MELAIVYLVGALVLVGMFAVRVPHEDVRVVFTLALAWPLSIAVIVFLFVLNATGWNLDAAKGTKMFSFRRPTNTAVRGFAVTIFYGEVQVWKSK